MTISSDVRAKTVTFCKNPRRPVRLALLNTTLNIVNNQQLHLRVWFQRTDTKKVIMTTEHLLIGILFMLYGAFGTSIHSGRIRRKRWDDTGDLSNMFRGTAGVDYPDLKTIPTTNFRCEDQLYEGGLYADVEAQCQVYHVCHDGRKDSFLCGKGTIFNQQILACDYWYSTDCESAPNYYYMNLEIGSHSSHAGCRHDGNQNNPNSDRNKFKLYTAPNQGEQRKIMQPGQGPAGHYRNDDQQPCNCIQNNYKAPWSFPSGQLNGKK